MSDGLPLIRNLLDAQAITRRMLTLAEDLVAARERAGLLDEPKANGQPQPVSTRVMMMPCLLTLYEHRGPLC